MVEIIAKKLYYADGIDEAELDEDDYQEIVLQNVPEFVLDQPQDFWLLYISNMNWDVNDEIVDAIIARQDADLAIIAYLFWGLQPFFYCEVPDHFAGSRVERILTNLKAGWYSKCEFWLPRSGLASSATVFVESALKEGSRPFDIPSCLFGPFDGRKAVIDFPLHAESIRLLEVWFQDFNLDVEAARHEQYWDRLERKETLAVLPKVSSDHAAKFSHLDMYAYCERLYGTRERIQMAHAGWKTRRILRRQLAAKNRPQSPIAFINRLTTFQQSVLAVISLSTWVLLVLWVTGRLS